VLKIFRSKNRVSIQQSFNVSGVLSAGVYFCLPPLMDTIPEGEEVQAKGKGFPGEDVVAQEMGSSSVEAPAIQESL